MNDAHEIDEEARENARELNETINRVRDVANQLSAQYNREYNETFKAAKIREGIVNFGDVVKTREKSDAKVKVYQMNQDTREIA